MKLFLSLAFILVAVDAPGKAWWVTERVTPSDTRYLGQSVDTLRVDFEKIAIFDCGSDNVFSPSQCQELAEQRAMFRVDMSIDKSSEILRWEVGLAETEAGQDYKILIASNLQDDEIEVVFSEYTVDTHFSALFVREGRLFWAHCLECGQLAEVLYEDGRWVLDWGDEY
ncbi:hypothetical protein [Natronospira bacteriovora]|uniref:Uncharacterized protein n=1 Tax=Natronospira bacteriovora TaxID=3069753 RepID=A0ABU0W8Z9_9GAMM|nr:hypothetical protein [Natronospira sp. AB-CW4]MDQ2070486.1 hypothetical protein [Natronospira sp. AB-CW4]